MKRLLGNALGLSTVLLLLMVADGCSRSRKNGGNAGPGVAPRAPGGEVRPIRDLMAKLAKGPESLTAVLNTELDTDPPPWDKLGRHCKELATLAGDMGKHEPPTGSKESWAQFTSALVESARALERAVEAKNKTEAVAAYGSIAGSCKACHREHRGKGGPVQGK